MLSFRWHAMFPGYLSHRQWHPWMSFCFCIDTNKPHKLSIKDDTISVHKCYNISMRKSEKIQETNVQLYLSVIISLYCIWCKRKETSNFWIPNKDKLMVLFCISFRLLSQDSLTNPRFLSKLWNWSGDNNRVDDG